MWGTVDGIFAKTKPRGITVYRLTRKDNPNIAHYLWGIVDKLPAATITSCWMQLTSLGFPASISMMLIPTGSYNTTDDSEENQNKRSDFLPPLPTKIPDSLIIFLVEQISKTKCPIFIQEHQISQQRREAKVAKLLNTMPPFSYAIDLSAAEVNVRPRAIRAFLDGDTSYPEFVVNDLLIEEARELSIDRAVRELCTQGYLGREDTPLTQRGLLGKEGFLEDDYFESHKGALIVVPLLYLVGKNGLLSTLANDGWIAEAMPHPSKRESIPDKTHQYSSPALF